MSELLTYCGKPLVRKGNEIFYGDMTERYVVRFEILSTKKEGKGQIPDRVSVQLIHNDSNKPLEQRIEKGKNTEKNSLFDALDLGFTWLARALKEQ